jgi:hypothetical protein
MQYAANNKQANERSDMKGGNIEYSNTVFKNRPFSSENKYGNRRRMDPKNFNNIVHPDDKKNYGGNQTPVLKDGDHFRAKEFFDNKVKLNI